MGKEGGRAIVVGQRPKSRNKNRKGVNIRQGGATIRASNINIKK